MKHCILVIILENYILVALKSTVLFQYYNFRYQFNDVIVWFVISSTKNDFTEYLIQLAEIYMYKFDCLINLKKIVF